MQAATEICNYYKLQYLLKHSQVLLRNLFKNRYIQFNDGAIWDDTLKCGSSIKLNKKSLNKIQQASVAEGDSNQWDFSTLMQLLLGLLRPNTLNPSEIQQLDNEDKLLRNLTDVRNKIMHHSSKSLSNRDFDVFWTELSQILLMLGDVQTEIDKLKDDSVFEPQTQVINEENFKEALQYNSLGVQAHKQNNFNDAIMFFMKSVELSDIGDHNRAIFYSNLSSSRLAFYEQQHDRTELFSANDERYRALQDAKKARNLRPIWWKGHFRVGKIYAVLNEHEKAINSFERAFGLSPMTSEIIDALNDSRSVYSRQSRREHFDPRFTHKTIPDQMEDHRQKLGIDSATYKELLSMAEKEIQNIDPSIADVEKGKRYMYGDVDVKIDYGQAAKYFARAAERGNAEGMYNLACMIDNGFGVPKDHYLAFKLLEQAAAQPPTISLPPLKNITNTGVAEAEHTIGLKYANGIAVPQNFGTAAYWYQRATDHGSASAANNLALFYENGTGVQPNLDKALELFELSAKRGDPNAMLSLARVSLGTLNIKVAKLWYERACEVGNTQAIINRKEFLEVADIFQNLIDQTNCGDLLISNLIKTMFNLFKAPESVSTSSDQPYKYLYSYKTLREYAQRGSKTAQRMCSAMEHYVIAMQIVIKVKNLTEYHENLFVRQLSLSYRLEHIVVTLLNSEMQQKIGDIIHRVLQRCSTQSNTNGSQLDEDARICYVFLHGDSFKMTNEFLQQCIEKYSKTPFFFECNAAVYGWLQQYQDVIYICNKGLEICPDYCELLYSKAVALRLLGEDMNEAIKAYEAFLAVAEKDHRKVPESYYAIATCYLKFVERENTLNIVKQIYNQGEAAEKLQLPCFLPYDSASKIALTSIFDPESLLDTEIAKSTNRRRKLKNPCRIEVIVRHRKWEYGIFKCQQRLKSQTIVTYSHPGKFKQQRAKSLVDLKPIFIQEMIPSKDHIYNGCVLSVTIIENTFVWSPSIHLVVEDEKFDCEQMCIYNFNLDEGKDLITNVFTIGSKMHVVNPYLRIGATDRKPLIRIDDILSIVMENDSEPKSITCRCCGESNPKYRCKKCQNTYYCSKDCQTIDWEQYKHRYMCRNMMSNV